MKTDMHNYGSYLIFETFEQIEIKRQKKKAKLTYQKLRAKRKRKRK